MVGGGDSSDDEGGDSGDDSGIFWVGRENGVEAGGDDVEVEKVGMKRTVVKIVLMVMMVMMEVVVL